MTPPVGFELLPWAQPQGHPVTFKEITKTLSSKLFNQMLCYTLYMEVFILSFQLKDEFSDGELFLYTYC